MLSRKVLALTLSALLTGCSTDSIPWVYRVDIPQGNIVEASALKQVKLGMTQDEISYLLGTPMLVDAFHQNRWDYFYRFDGGKGERTGYHAVLYFKGNKLTKIEKNGHFAQDKRA